MQVKSIHSFDITLEKMLEIQKLLGKKVRPNTLEIDKIKLISGIDISYHDKIGVCVIATVDFSNLKILDITHSISKVEINYKPGFLAFRELPLILQAWKKLQVNPDLVLFDGHGYLHPRRCGLATHGSFFLDKPTIGIGKKPFIGQYKEPNQIKGSFEYIKHEKEVIGVALRTKTNVKPIYVSVGNQITLDQAVNIITSLVDPKISKLPIPIHKADKEGRKIIEHTDLYHFKDKN